MLDGTNSDASVVKAEKVFSTRQKGEGLDCLVQEIAKNVLAMVPRQHLQNQDV